VDLSELDIQELGERVRALHGDDVYKATLARALAVATRNSVGAEQARSVPPVGESQGALTDDVVMTALRTEFLKLLRPN